MIKATLIHPDYPVNPVKINLIYHVYPVILSNLFPPVNYYEKTS